MHHALKKNMHFAAVRWNVLCVSVESIVCTMKFKSGTFLLTLFLDNLSNAESVAYQSSSE